MDNRILISLAKKYLSGKSKQEVLEIGCGDGNVIFDLYQGTDFEFHRIKGVDREWHEAIHVDLQSLYDCTVWENKKPAKENLYHYEVKDGLDYLKEEKRKYDLIIFSDLFHFLTPDEILGYLDKALEILKPNGSVYIKMLNDKRQETTNSFTTLLNKELKERICYQSNVHEIIEIGTHTYFWTKDLAIDAENRLKVYIPSLYTLIGESGFTKEQWKTINSNFVRNFREWKKKYLANNNQLTIEANFFGLLTAALKEEPSAIRLMGYIDSVLKFLSEHLSKKEKEIIVNNVFDLVVSKDHNYLNYLGELSVLANIKQGKKYNLVGVEIDRIAGDKSADFTIEDTETGRLRLFEVVNIHINKDDVDLRLLLYSKIIEKIKDKTVNFSEHKLFTLVPVIWGPKSDLQRLSALYKIGKVVDIPNVATPYAYCCFYTEERNRIYRFNPITDLFRNFEGLFFAELDFQGYHLIPD